MVVMVVVGAVVAVHVEVVAAVVYEWSVLVDYFDFLAEHCKNGPRMVYLNRRNHQMARPVVGRMLVTMD